MGARIVRLGVAFVRLPVRTTNVLPTIICRMASNGTPNGKTLVEWDARCNVDAVPE
jgi:hypothetical protein